MRLWRMMSLLRKLLDAFLRVRRGPSAPDNGDPLLALRGSGRELWADEHADEYVRRLREWPH
jgi:hypothetical protein